jgi:hypothetical protein
MIGDYMPIYVLDEKKSFCGRFVDLYWITIMFIGYPVFLIFEWIFWEINGKGPVKKY